MYGVDFQGIYNKYVLDKSRKINDTHLKNVCCVNTKKSCKYISLSVSGFICVKKTPLKEVLDKLSLEGKIRSKCDNCEGLGKYEEEHQEHQEHQQEQADS